MENDQFSKTPENSSSENFKTVSEEIQNINEKSEKYWGEPIFTYTSKQAEDDGFLFDITKLNPAWKKGLFNYVTTNLLNKGYSELAISDSDFDRLKFNIPNIIDLLNQSLQIVKKATKGYEPDTFFSGNIELPCGEKQQVFIQQNETGKFTIMLPEDY